MNKAEGEQSSRDGPISESVTLPDGSLWSNVVSDGVGKVAETLDEFRGRHRYNLADRHVQALNGSVPVYAQWDDHEVVNNWYPGEVLTDPRYTQEQRVDVLARRARRAFTDYFPLDERRRDAEGKVYGRFSRGPHLDLFMLDMRTYRGANSANLQPAAGPDTRFLGAEQANWLVDGLSRSRATWKAVLADMPLGVVVPDGSLLEGVSNADPGPPLGRELEIASLLRRIKRAGVCNVVWFTADVHYCAAHHYDPARAAFTDFRPFWEFVGGPIHAGSFGPNALDATFGPEVVFSEVADFPNQPPSGGKQFFGHVAIEGRSGAMTVRLVNTQGVTRFEQVLEPE
jgi:alkaline phosphatase D